MNLPGEATAEFPGPVAFEPFVIKGSSGRITLTARLGKGGMGTVYSGRNAEGRLLALKVLDAQAALTEEVMERFRREVRLTRGLDHPGIVRVHEAGIVGSGPLKGSPYYAMDYVRGRDLDRWRGERPRSPAECARLLMAVCEAMDYAHGRGVIHRDLKPGNVLVNEEGRPRIVDFGLAKTRADMQGLTRTGDIMGTPNFMPPEQALGHRQLIGPPTDVYALGAILYFLLTGRPPFKAPTAFATIAKVVREAPRAPSHWNPQVPPGLEQIVLKALEKQPVDRFPTCGDLGRALAPFAA